MKRRGIEPDLIDPDFLVSALNWTKLWGGVYRPGMKSTPRKTGRSTAYHTPPDGQKVDGLSKLAGGRWKVSPFPGSRP